MAEWYVTNRELIKGLAFNTGTSQNPTFTTACTSSEITLETDFDQTDFYVFCDAIQRHLLTGGSLTLSGTLKLDVNNSADISLLTKIHTFISSGTISQFNDKVQFQLLTSVSENTLTYTKYQADAIIKLSDIGGSAEDVSEFSFEILINGTATVTSA
jgi:hypothetical protein